MAESEGHRLTVEAIRIIAENGGSIGRSELRDAVGQEVPEERRDKKDPSGRLLWVGQLDHFAARFAKPIIGKDRASRSWFLTAEGAGLAYDEQRKVLPIDKIGERFKQWLDNASQSDAASAEKPARPADDKESDETQEQLEDVIADHIKQQDSKTGKWLENLVAALLRGMGHQYVTVSGQSGDGGIDVVAYKDKLGAHSPRIKVQVKHYTKGQEVGDADILRLAKVVHENEVGLFVTSSSFSPKAKKCARESEKHLELIGIDRLVRLWVEHYPNMADADQELIPLRYELDTSRIKTKDDAAD